MPRRILEHLADPTLVAVRSRGAAWPRAVFAPTPIPEAWMGLVRKPDGRRTFVPAGEDPGPDPDDTLVLVRNHAVAVPVAAVQIPAADDHPVDVAVELLVRCPARDDDLAALHDTLLVEPELTLARLRTAVEDAGAAAALQRFIQAHPARELVHADPREPLLEALRAALRSFLFAAGLVLERLGRLEFRSASLVRQEALEREAARRVQELEARGVVERAALAATRRRLDDLGEILAKLKAAARAEAGVQWHALLPALTPGERGRLLENLWRITPDRTTAEAVVLVAGRECVWLDPRAPEQPVRRVSLPGELGGLRSITFDAAADALFVGAAAGVWRLDARSGSVLGRFAVPGAGNPRTGFNAAVVAGGRLVATHSQLGAWSWALADPADAHPLLQPIEGVPRTIRAAVVDDSGRLLLAADDRAHGFAPDGQALWQSGRADGAIHALAPLDDSLYAATASGALLRCDLALPGEWLVLHRAAGPIESVQARRWDDLTELVIPGGALGVCGVYAAEGIVARLLPAPFPIRRAWACDDALVGLSEHRDRLVVCSGAAEDAARAGREVPVARLLGSLVQDACLLTRTRAGPAGAGPADDSGAGGTEGSRQ